MCTAEMLADLVEALASPEAAADLVGVLQAWAELASGEVGLEDRVSLTPSGEALLLAQEERKLAAALALARQGPLSTAQLAKTLGTCQETARVIAKDLERRGLLRAQGSNRDRRYILQDEKRGGARDGD